MSGNCVRCAVAVLIMVSSTVAHAQQAAGGYQGIKACSLVPLAEMKKIAPWPPDVVQPEAEEVGLAQRSLCVYPTAQVQVEPYRSQIIDSARKTARLDSVPGVGDEAYIRNDRDLFAVIYVKSGPHLLTVEMEIAPGSTYETTKPKVVEIAKAFAAKLR